MPPPDPDSLRNQAMLDEIIRQRDAAFAECAKYAGEIAVLQATIRALQSLNRTGEEGA